MVPEHILTWTNILFKTLIVIISNGEVVEYLLPYMEAWNMLVDHEVNLMQKWKKKARERV